MARTTADVAYEVLTAYLSSNVVPSGDIPGLLVKVHEAILAVHGKGLPVYTPAEVPAGDARSGQPVVADPRGEGNFTADELARRGNDFLKNPATWWPTNVNCDRAEYKYPNKENYAEPDNITVFDDYIICLEDGRKQKTLKRRLWSQWGITPEKYRERWGLPDNYPMAAPKYRARAAEIITTHKPYALNKKKATETNRANREAKKKAATGAAV